MGEGDRAANLKTTPLRRDRTPGEPGIVLFRWAVSQGEGMFLKTKTMTILLVLFVVLLAWAISDNRKENRRFLDYREQEERDFEK